MKRCVSIHRARQTTVTVDHQFQYGMRHGMRAHRIYFPTRSSLTRLNATLDNLRAQGLAWRTTFGEHESLWCVE